MPYELLERSGKYCVAKKDGEVLKCYGNKVQATAYLRALYANVPDAQTAGADIRPVGESNPASYQEGIIAASEPDVKTLAMVAVYPRSEEQQELAVEGGNKAETIHATLVFLGEAEEVDLQVVFEVLEEIGAEFAPLEGYSGGVGQFEAGENGIPVFAIPNVQGLSNLREEVARRLADRGIESPSEHAWNAHITLMYSESGDDVREVKKVPLHFDAITLSRGNDRLDFPFQGSLQAAGKPGFSADEFNKRWAEGSRLAAGHFDELVLQYERAFEEQARKSQDAYRGQGLTADGVSPDIPDGIINKQDFKNNVTSITDPQRKRIVTDVQRSILKSKADQAKFDTLRADIGAIQAELAYLAVSDAVHSAIQDGIDGGLSVQQTAGKIGEVMTDWAPWQARRQAQTDLISLANGASLLSAQALGTEGPKYKTWLSAGDDRVRETHRELNHQTVPLDEPWNVDGADIQFPGDPSAPDALKINCRCTQVYSDVATPALVYGGTVDVNDEPVMAIAASVYDETKHPRYAAGSRLGGQFSPKSGTSSAAAQKQAETSANDKQKLEDAVRINDRISDDPFDPQQPTTNPVYTATLNGQKVAVKPEASLAKDVLRPNITPGLDLPREEAAFLVANRIENLDPQLAVDVPDFQIIDDPELGRVGVSDWAEGSTAGGMLEYEWEPGTRRNEALYDSIIGNQDRNLGNVIVNDGNVALIDHGLAFPEGFERGSPDELNGRRVWDAGSPQLNVGEMSLLESLQENREAITSEDLRGLPVSAQNAFWDRIQTMQESGVRV